MTKASKKSGTKASKSVKKKRAARGAQAPVRAIAEDIVDGCDVEIEASKATPDIALPPAKGGVGLSRRRSAKG
jgi:hypothetical protein